jgi:serine/threonine-protein kinase
MKRIAPRLPTPTPGTKTGPFTPAGFLGTTGRLPEDLLAEQVQRLGVFSAVAGGLWTFGLLMDLVFLRIAESTFRPWAVVTAIEIAGIVLAAMMFAYVRYGKADADTKASAGVAYFLANTFGVGLLNAWLVPAQVPTMHVSWNAVAILVFSMILPTSPRRMLMIALAAASMDPLALAILKLQGAPVLPLVETLVLCLPTYVCALVATVPSHVFQRWGRKLKEAQELGSYQLIELLGRGGMGEVWRAEHRLLARSAAIKLVSPEVLGAASEAEARLAMRRFEREAQATAALSSPHTIQLFDYGMTDEGTFYYVMELLSGRDLESLVRDFGPLPADRALFLLRQVCHSLADAHARGLVHRDIKPANIYVCRMGLEYDFIKVLDFGLVKFRARGTRETLVTLDHRTSGTPAYMAPEIILGEADVDRRADVYALGCVAYFALTGQLVFEADTPMRMLLQHVQAQPVAPSQRTELPIPRLLDEFVLACLEKDPDKRPQDAEALLKMAVNCCKACNESWTSDTARRWWERHVPELTGPLTLEEPIENRRPIGIV